MARGHGRLAARNGGCGSGERPRYTSQPQLTGCDYHMDGRRSFAQPGGGGGGRCDSPDTLSLPPLSARTSVSFPRRSAHERTVEAVKGEEGVGGAYPDLARHPLSYTTAPPPQYHANTNNQGCSSLWRWMVLFAFVAFSLSKLSSSEREHRRKGLHKFISYIGVY
jgi:hypothetical protein